MAYSRSFQALDLVGDINFLFKKVPVFWFNRQYQPLIQDGSRFLIQLAISTSYWRKFSGDLIKKFEVLDLVFAINFSFMKCCRLRFKSFGIKSYWLKFSGGIFKKLFRFLIEVFRIHIYVYNVDIIEEYVHELRLCAAHLMVWFEPPITVWPAV